jgi:Rad3-related DNA helicase
VDLQKQLVPFTAYYSVSNRHTLQKPLNMPSKFVFGAANRRDPQAAYQVPQAVLKLKQGFGRLIRTKKDTGLVVILDPRVLTKRYGQLFLDALPACRRFVDGVAEGEKSAVR